MTLSWAVPASDGGAPVTRYEYRYTTGTSAFPDSWTTVPGGAGARAVTVDSLDNGIRHRFQVRAVTFNQGQTRAEIEFSTSDDHVNEDDEVVVLTLGPTLPKGFRTADRSTTEITIVDDDELGVKLSPEALALNEPP